ncbi:DUF2381 family protein [Archangium gephyra]|uniref:DUF2381 family protein n=1 Tax=Archangium gephyra TaxID=48 RepID=UPI003B7E8BB8
MRLSLNQMGEDGIPSKLITKDIALRPGESFTVERAMSYRATGGEKEVTVTRLAVDMNLRNQGGHPWTPTHAQLVGEGVRWDLEVWSPRPLAPGELSRVLVEVDRPGRAASGPYVLKLWDQSTNRTATLSGVTLP